MVDIAAVAATVEVEEEATAVVVATAEEVSVVDAVR
jgi:hypothetical protein